MTAAYLDHPSGSGTRTLTFQYTIGASDVARNGISMSGAVDLNCGTISIATYRGCNNYFTVPNLSGVKIIPVYIYVADAGNNRIVQLAINGGYVATVTSGLTYGAGGLTVDPSGNVWVASCKQILKYVYNGSVRCEPGKAEHIFLPRYNDAARFVDFHANHSIPVGESNCSPEYG